MYIHKRITFLGSVLLLSLLTMLSGCVHNKPQKSMDSELTYEYEDTREVVELVNDAADKIYSKGKAAFSDFREAGSGWRQNETYIFVLDTSGNMLVHPDPELQGKNQLELKDINGKPIIQGLINTATADPERPEGWYHYEWPVPGGLLPRWKSTYVRLVTAPSGKSYIIGSGMYNDRMERAFVVDLVENAVHQIEKKGKSAFPLFYDPTGPYIAKDSYIFITDMNGKELVNPAFPNLEGRDLMDVQDTHGKYLVREMINVVKTSRSGWIDYMWPKPGESVSTKKSTYVSKAKIGDQWLMVGSGVYLADAPKAKAATDKMSTTELKSLVEDAAKVLEMKGENAYPEFRIKGSKWFHGDTYLFVWDMDGKRVFHAANPEGEGKNMRDFEDIKGRPIGKMILDAGKSTDGEGWIHYMYPEPGDIFPTWKSTFVKRVTFPSGKKHILGCGIYNMEMNKTFIEDIVNRAANLVSKNGRGAFGKLRDKTGPFFFMDTYVFVMAPDGTELVNPAQPSLEGRNLWDLKDLKGNKVVSEEINAAMKHGSAWQDMYWFKPGENISALKRTFVRKVRSGDDIFIVGSGFYPKD